jgi:hypothetical protein
MYVLVMSGPNEKGWSTYLNGGIASYNFKYNDSRINFSVNNTTPNVASAPVAPSASNLPKKNKNHVGGKRKSLRQHKKNKKSTRRRK